MTKTRLIVSMFFAVLCAPPGKAVPPKPFLIPEKTDAIFNRYCHSCHDEDTQKGDIRLDNLTDIEFSKRLDLLNRMQEQVFFSHMPPKKKSQPSETERDAMMKVISKELNAHGASSLEDKLKKPEYGNYVDHDKLFSGEYHDLPGFTHDRRWLISEYIFNAKFQRILENTPRARHMGKMVSVQGSGKIQNLSLTNPFLLPERSGVRYYANEDLTGGHLSSMLTNAQKTSEYITDYLVPRKKGKYLPAIAKIMALEDKHNATLSSRRAFLENFIARLCEELYGGENESLLPAFNPVELKEVKALAEGETYKKAPFHVARNMLKNLEGDSAVYQFLLEPKYEKKSDEEFRDLCERTWFYFGDHERKIQGRMTILRDYLPEIREHVVKDRRKIKPIVYKPLENAEMEAVKKSLLKHRKKGRFLCRGHRQMHGGLGARIRAGTHCRRTALGRTPVRACPPIVCTDFGKASRPDGNP